MKRREFLANTTAMGIIMTTYGSQQAMTQNSKPDKKLIPPNEGTIPVAFTVSEGVTVIDFCGPWEVFQDVNLGKGGQERDAFNLFTVSEKTEPVRGSAGLKIVGVDRRSPGGLHCQMTDAVGSSRQARVPDE